MFCSTKITQKNIFFDYILKKKLLKTPILLYICSCNAKEKKGFIHTISLCSVGFNHAVLFAARNGRNRTADGSGKALCE